MSKITFGSLFTGIGGFDLGFERAGMECAWQCEINKFCRKLLEDKWPEVKKYGDIRELVTKLPERVNILCGGDPCPAHSKARSNGASKHPDLSGYLLALVGRLCPQWVVRENVPNPITVKNFAAVLGLLGYGTIIVELDAVNFTCQSRKRAFVIGCSGASREKVATYFSESTSSTRDNKASNKTRAFIPCLTANAKRSDTRDGYFFENGGLRILDSAEREAIAGFPQKWTFGFSETTRVRMMGNAIVPACAEWIGKRIVEVCKNEND